jgi:hypothetical protein
MARKINVKVRKNDINNNNDKIIIGENDLSISQQQQQQRDIKVICNYCLRVADVRISDDEWFCNNCQVTIIPSLEDVRTVQDLEVPKGVSDETLITHVPSPGESDVQIKHEPEPQGAFKMLKNKGLKITNYE